jgi:transposase
VFKAKVALDAVRREKTLGELAELAKLHSLHSNQITDWKSQMLDCVSSVFLMSRHASATNIG